MLDYFKLHNNCREVLVNLTSAFAGVIPQFYATYIETNMNMPFAVGYVFSTAAGKVLSTIAMPSKKLLRVVADTLTS
jgi:hypothetical protein